YLRLKAYSFVGLSEGAYDLNGDLCRRTSTNAYPLSRYSPSNPSVARTDGLTTELRNPWKIFLFDTQAACAFRCSASKRPPFFQSVNVMAAILRASVRRAISGFIPLPSKPT